MAFFCSAALWLILVGACFGQETSRPASEFGNRFDGFQLLFSDRGWTLGSIEALRAGEPAEWAIVLLSAPGASLGADFDFAGFVRAGGTLLVASEWSGVDFPGKVGINVRPGPVQINPQRAHRQIPTCPILRDFATSPLMESVGQIVVNRSGWLAGVGSLGSALAVFPRGCWTDEDRLPTPSPAICAGALGGGRWLVAADSSIFANEMLLELDNLFFARNCVEWLQNDQPGRPKRIVFVTSEGPISSWIDRRFETGDWQSLWSKILEKFGNLSEEDLALINKLIAGLQSEGIPNRLLSELQQQTPTRLSLQLMAILPTILVGLLLLYRLASARPTKLVFRGTPTDPPIRWIGNPQMLTRAKSQQWLERDNLLAPARRLAQMYFESLGAPQSWESAPKALPASLQPQGWWQRKLGVGRQLRSLWRLAVGIDRRQRRAGDFRKLQSQVLALQRAYRRSAPISS